MAHLYIGHAIIVPITGATAYRARSGEYIRSGFLVTIPGAGVLYRSHCRTKAMALGSAAAMSAMYAKYQKAGA